MLSFNLVDRFDFVEQTVEDHSFMHGVIAVLVVVHGVFSCCHIQLADVYCAGSRQHLASRMMSSILSHELRVLVHALLHHTLRLRGGMNVRLQP